MSEYIKDTPWGGIKGIESEQCLCFRGIRYARAERFALPIEETFAEGIYDATQNGACCYQHRAFEEDALVNPFYHLEFRRGLHFRYSEDCLFLNIWTPKQAENCPVLIFIHGGSFTGGSCDEAHISGERFAEKGIITVAINYRLGPFGFCAHQDLPEANFGLYDQTVAIEWVLHNIAAFGGDPENVTLMGQSAGAMSVDIHLNNPALKGKFKGAIMLSGAGLQRGLLKPLTIEKITPFWDKVMSHAGVCSMEEMKAVDPKTLYYAWKDACKEMTLSLPYTFPIYDERILSKEQFKMSGIPDMPYLIGCTCTDMIPIVLEGVDKKWGRQTAKNTAPCYFYNFNRELPGDNMGAWHSADLLYAFYTLDKNWRPFEKADYQIAAALSDAIVAFTKFSDPNCAALPAWRPGHKQPMSFAKRSGAARWKTMENIKVTLTGKGKTI